MPQRLEVSGDVFKQILSIAADAIVTVDASQRIVLFNHGAEDMFGYTEHEALQLSLDALLPVRSRAVHPALVEAFGASGDTARLMGHRREVYGRRKSGEEFPAEASIMKLEAESGVTLYTAVVRDVTERKRADAQQRLLADMISVLAESLDYDATAMAVVMLPVPRLADAAILDLTDVNGKLQRFVHADSSSNAHASIEALRQLGAPLADSPSVVNDVIRRKLAQLVAPLTEDWIEAHSDNPAESTAWRSLSAHSLLVLPLVARGHVLGALTLVSSTEREIDRVIADDVALRAAFALDNARLYGAAQRATRARDEILGVVSHDLGNPLNAISMCAKVLVEHSPADDATRDTLATTIQESAAWASRLIQDLVDVAALESGRLAMSYASVSVSDIARRLVQTFAGAAAERGVSLVEDVPLDLMVRVDAERIVQAAANLLSNALKFTDTSGSISIVGRASMDAVELSVVDSGIGIPPEHMPYVFDRYWHRAVGRRQPGSGLGLAVARGIVEAHGGTLSVKSEVGRGTSFTMSLPIGERSEE